jgi:hypothetical protein
MVFPLAKILNCFLYQRIADESTRKNARIKNLTAAATATGLGDHNRHNSVNAELDYKKEGDTC